MAFAANCQRVCNCILYKFYFRSLQVFFFVHAYIRSVYFIELSQYNCETQLLIMACAVVPEAKSNLLRFTSFCVFIDFRLLCVCIHVLTRIWNRTFFSSVSARAESFFSKSKFLKLLFCWTSWIALTNLPYSSSRSLWVYKHDKQTNKNKSKNTCNETVIINYGDSFCL